MSFTAKYYYYYRKTRINNAILNAEKPMTFTWYRFCLRKLPWLWWTKQHILRQKRKTRYAGARVITFPFSKAGILALRARLWNLCASAVTKWNFSLCENLCLHACIFTNNLQSKAKLNEYVYMKCTLLKNICVAKLVIGRYVRKYAPTRTIHFNVIMKFFIILILKNTFYYWLVRISIIF